MHQFFFATIEMKKEGERGKLIYIGRDRLKPNS